MTRPDYCPVAQEPCQLMCILSDVRCKIRDTAPQVTPQVTTQEKQEPVCDKDPQGCWNVRCQLGKVCKNATPPAAQRTWVGLTDEEKEDATGWSVEHIEAKLKEKNTQEPIKWSDYESDGRIIQTYPEKDKT
jgi:hypothetical protein